VSNQFMLMGVPLFNSLLAELEDAGIEPNKLYSWISRNYEVYGIDDTVPKFKDKDGRDFTLNDVVNHYLSATSKSSGAAAAAEASPARAAVLLTTPIKPKAETPFQSPFVPYRSKEDEEIIKRLESLGINVEPFATSKELKEEYTKQLEIARRRVEERRANEARIKAEEEARKKEESRLEALRLEEARIRAEEEARLKALKEAHRLEREREKEERLKRREEIEKNLEAVEQAKQERIRRQQLQRKEEKKRVKESEAANLQRQQEELMKQHQMEEEARLRAVEERKKTPIRKKLAAAEPLTPIAAPALAAAAPSELTEEMENEPIAKLTSTSKKMSDIRPVIDKYYTTYPTNSFAKKKINAYLLAKFCADNKITVNEGFTRQNTLTLSFDNTNGTSYNISEMVQHYFTMEGLGQGFKALGIHHGLKHIKKQMGTIAHKKALNLLRKL